MYHLQRSMMDVPSNATSDGGKLTKCINLIVSMIICYKKV